MESGRTSKKKEPNWQKSINWVLILTSADTNSCFKNHSTYRIAAVFTDF